VSSTTSNPQSVVFEFRVALCLDCISSVGTVPLAWGVYWQRLPVAKDRSYPVSWFSIIRISKGSVPRGHEFDRPAHLPRYLDLDNYANATGIPFTFRQSAACLRRLKTCACDNALPLWGLAHGFGPVSANWASTGARMKLPPGSFPLAFLNPNSVALGVLCRSGVFAELQQDT